MLYSLAISCLIFLKLVLVWMVEPFAIDILPVEYGSYSSGMIELCVRCIPILRCTDFFTLLFLFVYCTVLVFHS